MLWRRTTIGKLHGITKKATTTQRLTTRTPRKGTRTTPPITPRKQPNCTWSITDLKPRQPATELNGKIESWV